MTGSVSTFFRNFIKYFLLIAVFAQIVSGTVYLVCNFTEFALYPETADLVHTGRSLLFDEYTGILYPLFLRTCLGIQQFCGIGYYIFAYFMQLVLFVLSSRYLVKCFFKGKMVWLVCAFIVAFPMCIQTILMVSPYALQASFSFVIIGAGMRLLKNREEIRVREVLFLMASYMLSALNVPDSLYMWLLPILILVIVLLIRKQKGKQVLKKTGVILLAVGVFFMTFGILEHTVEKGARGRMQKSVESVLFQRILWPELNVKYGFLPEELRLYIEEGEAVSANLSAESFPYLIGPTIERAVGYEKANELYIEAVRGQLAYNKREIFRVVMNDFIGYLTTPYSMIWYLNGQEGSAISTLYGQMLKANPIGVFGYFCSAFVSMFVLLFVSVLNLIRHSLYMKKEFWRTAILFGGILAYMALWFAIVNVQGVDYRYTLLNVVLFSIFAIKGSVCHKSDIESSICHKSDVQSREKKKVILGRKTKGILCAIFAVFCLLVIVAGSIKVFGKGYRHGEEMVGKKIICLGDSIWGLVNDETGIASKVEDMTGATIENYAMSGTTATDTMDTSKEDVFSPYSLGQIVELLEKKEEVTDERLKEIVNASFSDADYLILAYGLNDYFAGITIESQNPYDKNTYAGSLRYAVRYFKESYPDLQIVLVGQTYCQFYSYGIVEEDSDTRNYGGGVGMDYVEAVERVAKETGVIFVSGYDNIPMNEWNGKMYLQDATHLNEKGRIEYAKMIAECLLEDNEERNAQ